MSADKTWIVVARTLGAFAVFFLVICNDNTASDRASFGATSRTSWRTFQTFLDQAFSSLLATGKVRQLDLRKENILDPFGRHYMPGTLTPEVRRWPQGTLFAPVLLLSFCVTINGVSGSFEWLHLFDRCWWIQHCTLLFHVQHDQAVHVLVLFSDTAVLDELVGDFCIFFSVPKSKCLVRF